MSRHPRRLVILGNAGSRRVRDMLRAAARLGWPPPRVVDYADYLDGRDDVVRWLVPGGALRLESPGECWETERRLLGEGTEPAAAERSDALTRPALARLRPGRGAIVRPRQWYLGFVRLLERLERELEAAPPVTLLGSPRDIPVLFDKTRCQERFLRAGLPIPEFWPGVRSYDELRERFRGSAHRRLFVKLAHGSGAMGAVALEWLGPRVRALTTVEQVAGPAGTQLFMSKKLRSLTGEAEVASLIDALAPEKLHVEAWLPKARIERRLFDLRVVAIAGRARHVVGRLSATPFTNLNLGGGRAGRGAVRRRLGPHWRAALRLAEDAAAVFPESFCLGIDVLVRPGCRGFALLEANAFGDLLHRTTLAGRDAYEAQLWTLERQEPREARACAT